MIQSKKERMIKWMKSTMHGRKDFRENKGFMVTERICVQRKDGSFQPITKILLELGFADKEEIAGYRVRYQDRSTEFPEAFQFFVLQPPIPEPDSEQRHVERLERHWREVEVESSVLQRIL